MASTTNETHTSAACCTNPVAAASYTVKGTYSTLALTKCYITGPVDAKKAIIYLYDAFGFRAQSFQGADIIAAENYLVIMPDLFDDEPAEPEWMDLPDEQKAAALGAWRSKVADSKLHIERIYRVVEAVKREYDQVEKLGAIGFCWGGKLVALTSGTDTPWHVGIQSSPGRIDAADAAKTTIPTMVLASKEEPAADVAAFSGALTVPKHVETFDSQIHGWMSARAALDNEHVRNEYLRGYKLAIEWFGKHL